MPAYQTVIFDLDGTLLDVLEDLTDSTNHVLALHGLPLRSAEEVRSFMGNGVRHLIHQAVPAGTSPETEALCLEEFLAYYTQNMENKTTPYPGILALLDTLEAHGVQRAVVSNKIDGAVKALCQSYFGSRIPVAIGESENVARKPAPDTALRALKDLGADAAGAVYVGDSEVDIATARNAGLPCISVSWGTRDRDLLLAHGPDRIVDSPEELLCVLLNG